MEIKVRKQQRPAARRNSHQMFGNTNVVKRMHNNVHGREEGAEGLPVVENAAATFTLNQRN